MMKKKLVFLAIILTVALAGLVPGAAMAASGSRLWLVHGVNGLDMGSAAMQYPVDIAVDELGCVAPRMMFMRATGGWALSAGWHTVTISPANASPCSQAPIATANLYFDPGVPFTVVFYLNSAGAPTISNLPMDLTHKTSYNGKSRFTVMNAAYSAPVDLFIRLKNGNRTQTVKIANDLGSGQSLTYMGRSGSWKWWFTDAASANNILAPVLWKTRTHYAYFIFLVGSPANGYYTASFSINTKP